MVVFIKFGEFFGSGGTIIFSKQLTVME